MKKILETKATTTKRHEQISRILLENHKFQHMYFSIYRDRYKKCSYLSAFYTATEICSTCCGWVVVIRIHFSLSQNQIFSVVCIVYTYSWYKLSIILRKQQKRKTLKRKKKCYALAHNEHKKCNLFILVQN